MSDLVGNTEDRFSHDAAHLDTVSISLDTKATITTIIKSLRRIKQNYADFNLNVQYACSVNLEKFTLRTVLKHNYYPVTTDVM